MDKEIIFYLIPAWMVVGGPFLYVAFSKTDKVNKYLFENKNSFWVELGSFRGVFKKIESGSKDPFALMRFNLAIITGKVNKEVEDAEILSDLKTIKVCTLIWNLIGIPVIIIFFSQLLKL